MELEQLIREINEDLNRKVVPMEELRAGIRDGKFAIIGTWALRLPNGRKYVGPEGIGEAVVLFESPDDGRRVLEDLLQRYWPYG